METLAQIRARVQDLLDVDTSDTYHSPASIDAAINTALFTAADRLMATTSRRRYMKRVADLSADGDFTDNTLTWAMPAEVRRVWKLWRGGIEVKPVRHEHDFARYGPDGFIILGRNLILTENTDPSELAVWYFYKPATLSGDSSTPDFIEGYEHFLALEAAALRVVKEPESSRGFRNEADRMWPQLILAARNDSWMANIGDHKGAFNDDWKS